MNCRYCKKPIILIPSAEERAKKTGGKPSDYTRLFTSHSQCLVEARSRDARTLLNNINWGNHET